MKPKDLDITRHIRNIPRKAKWNNTRLDTM